MEKMTVTKAQEILKKYEMYKAFPFYAQPCEANDAIHAYYFMEGFSAQEEAAKRLVEALKFSIRSFVSLTRGNRFDASFEIKMIQEALAPFQKLREKELK